MHTTVAHYSQPTKLQMRFNDIVRWLSDQGVGVAGARTLTVVGRTSGAPHSVPVNPVTIDHGTFVVSPRGNTQWSRNLRAAPTCELRRGRSSVTYTATEIHGAAKLDVLRPYLKRWGWEVASYLPTKVSHTSSDDELLAVAESVPIFALHAQPS